MKKRFLLLIISFISTCAMLQAQPGCVEKAEALINDYNERGILYSDSSFTLANKLQAINENCNSDSIYGLMNLYIAEGHYYQSQLDSAIYFYRMADGYFQKAGDSANMVLILFNLGTVYNEMGQVDLSISNYLSALPYYEKLADTTNIALINYNISLLFFDQGNLKGAKKLLTETKELCEPHYRYNTIYPDVLQMLGHMYYLNGNNDSAKLLLTAAIPFADTTFLDLYKAYTFANLALINIEDKVPDSAAHYIDKALEIARNEGDVFSQASYLTIKADVANSLNQYAYAKTLVDSALLIADYLSSIVLKEMSYNMMQELYATQGDYKNAYRYQDSLYTMRDSIRRQSAEASILHYEREKRIERNRILEAENELVVQERLLKEEQLKERTILLVIIAMLLILLGVAASYLYRLSQKRKRLNDAKDTILSVISHDLRGPIVQMKTLADLLADQSTSAEQNQKILQNFNLSITNLQKSFENILFWSKTQMQGLHVDPQEVNLCDILSEMINFHYQSLVTKSLTFNKPEPKGIKVWVDSNHLQIALRNILSNAIKFSNKNSAIHVAVTTTETHAVIRIKDEGIGIEPQEMKKILNKRISFSRLGTINEKGTGLGVMLSKQFILANGGVYEMESKPGAGTTVIITLPLANTSARPLVGQA